MSDPNPQSERAQQLEELFEEWFDHPIEELEDLIDELNYEN